MRLYFFSQFSDFWKEFEPQRKELGNCLKISSFKFFAQKNLWKAESKTAAKNEHFLVEFD